MFKRILILFSMIIITAGCKQKVYKINVIRIIDNRYESISNEQFSYILNKSKEVMKGYFDVEIEYIDMGKEQMQEFFVNQSKKISDSKRKEAEEMRYDIFSGDIAKFKDNLLNSFKRYKLEELKGFLPEEERERIKDYEQMVDRVMEIYKEKLDVIKKARARDKPLLDPDKADLYSFVQWALIVMNLDKYDIIFTNVPLIDDMFSDPYIHTLIRGGITCGFVNPSKTGSEYKESIYFTFFPFVSDIDFLILERDDDYPQELRERNDIIAYQLCHELGHLILKYDDAYNHQGCILNPPKGLRYKEWYSEIIKKGKCRKKHKQYKVKRM